jgi:hypothetical protein
MVPYYAHDVVTGGGEGVGGWGGGGLAHVM